MCVGNEEGLDVRLHRFVDQLGDYFALNKNVAGSISAGAPFQSNAQSFFQFFQQLFSNKLPSMNRDFEFQQKNIRKLD